MIYLKVFSPARFDLAGGTLDLPPISSILKNSNTINCTLDKGVFLTFEKSEKIQLVNKNSNVSDFYPTENKDLILLSKGIEFFSDFIKFPFKLTLESQLPKGSGLGVSSVILITLLKSLSKLFNKKITNKELVYIAANIESSIINCPAGLQDYIAPIYGGLSKITFPHNGFKVEKLKLKKQLIENILFVYTGISHFSGAPNFQLLKLFIENKDYYNKFEKLCNISNNMYKMLNENKIENVGKLMKEDFNVRQSFPVKLIPYVPNLFSVLEKCNRISGFRVCGAAGGGTVALVTENGTRNDVKEMLKFNGLDVLDLKPADLKYKEMI